MRRILAWVFGSVGAVLLAAVVGILIWSQVGVMGAEPEALAAVRADPGIVLTDDSAAIVLSPAAGAGETGLVYIPGAKVDPWAYASKLSGLVTERGMTVVITKPWLNLAFFDLRGLDSFTGLSPDTATWIVGGHSLGGVRACQLATDADALALFGSYCANDLSASGLPVLSIAGSEDGLSTPEKIADARDQLPADAELIEIPGAGHSSFGDYGLQPGDGTPTIPDADMRADITSLVGDFAASVG
ncbi:alpha/beta hydrolase [Microbacterium sp. cx-55]|uniref:alpha/beta hydrolase n=1 Tax=Microbacterium sp. cx-55 TaxID=2875948 RepID=UPI001CBC8AF7|nr:alpha/beta hydrolase [Microbacterium sp. cx-55]MBZ4487055.1 alpha/beta hydrolase [Microbacterium sp. cx-55]UGB36650.1 alpha/beta hydrolase [Microbacterium sp. cx-55]